MTPAQQQRRTELLSERSDLIMERAELQEKLDSIKSQLEAARTRAAANGEYSDRDWYRRAEHARRSAGAEILDVNTRISQIKDELRALPPPVESSSTLVRIERMLVGICEKLEVPVEDNQ